MPTPPTNAAPLVCCILVNWNGAADTLPCIASLLQQDYSNLRIFVVDNGSSDDSVARIRSTYPQVTVLETCKNLGFASGCNVGIRRAIHEGADYIWLLNNDTVAPPDTCTKLFTHAHSHPTAGLIGSVLYYMHAPTQVQAWGGGNLTTWLGHSTHFTAATPLGRSSYLTFASVLIPSEVILKVGILYEGSFMYWDDSDYALRVTRAGYSLSVAEDTAILHKEGGSTTRRNPIIDRYSTAAGLHFLRRHSPVPLVSMAIFPIVKFANRILRGHWKNAQAVLAGISDYRHQRYIPYVETL